MKTKSSVILMMAALGAAACKPSGDAGSAAPVAESKPKHPWDWIPEDPALVAGREVYQIECSLCHDEGEEGAPPLTDKEDWQRRTEKGTAVLYDHAINGWQGPDGKMPARGGTPELTDEEVISAVNYMLATPK